MTRCTRCGEQNPAEIHTCTPPMAIRLADAYEATGLRDHAEVAAELRRLHNVEQEFQQWIDKIEWVQKSAQPQDLGMHRADVMKQRLGNLLAMIHGDGGHYIEAHGWDKAQEDAEAKVATILTERNRWSQPVAAQKDAVFDASIELIETLTGMKPPPIEIAPPEIFKPFQDFTEKVCSIFFMPPASNPDDTALLRR